MARNVYIGGAGIFPFGQHPDVSLVEMAGATIRAATEASEHALADIEEAFVGNALGHSGAVAAVAEGVGLKRVPVTRIEQACASGSTALRQACEAVASGRRETVLALGIEKMGSGLLQFEPEPTYAARLGLDLFPLLYGLKSRQYIDDCGASLEDLADVAVKARKLGAAAHHAATQAPANREEILGSPMIAEPVTRLQCCRNADGAAAAIITSRPRRRPAPRIAGWVGGLAVEDTAKPMRGGWDSRERVVKDMSGELYQAAGLGPEDVEIVQLNDAFSVAEPLYLEALGFAPAGEGYVLQREGRTELTSDLPTNTDGGLIGRGHCLGATGLAMLYEIWLQICGAAGARQAPNRPKVGLIQSHGYGGENLFAVVA